MSIIKKSSISFFFFLLALSTSANANDMANQAGVSEPSFPLYADDPSSVTEWESTNNSSIFVGSEAEHRIPVALESFFDENQSLNYKRTITKILVYEDTIFEAQYTKRYYFDEKGLIFIGFSLGTKSQSWAGRIIQRVNYGESQASQWEEFLRLQYGDDEDEMRSGSPKDFTMIWFGNKSINFVSLRHILNKSVACAVVFESWL